MWVLCICQCMANLSFAFWNFRKFFKYFLSMIGWIYRCGTWGYRELTVISSSNARISKTKVSSLLFYDTIWRRLNKPQILGDFYLFLFLKFFYLFLFYGLGHAIWKFLGQTLNPSHSCDLNHSCSNTGSFNPLCWARDPTPASSVTPAAAVEF